MTAEFLLLHDWRMQVTALYRTRLNALMAGEQPDVVCRAFRRERDRLFTAHPQSPLDAQQKQAFRGLPYFPYNPETVVEAGVDPEIEPGRLVVQLAGDETVPLERVANLRFTLAGRAETLTLYWIDVYGGGLFLPFRDGTAPGETYGGGRYLLDTVKGSDMLWPDDRRVLLDFNYAYNRSCAYNPRWVCPLAPAENQLATAVRAGELRFADYPKS